MAVERKLFIAETAQEVLDVKDSCTYIGDFDGGEMWHDHMSKNHDLWYIDLNELDAGEKEKYEEWMTIE